MSAAPDNVIVRVPGSTSNCGAGFDTLGLALNVHNDVALRRLAPSEIKPVRASDARAQEMVAETAEAFFGKIRAKSFGFSYQIDGDVPPARGLGSSVTVRAGIVGGLNALSGAPLSRHDIVALVTDLEGHPDNASAGVLGGFCVARCEPKTNAYVDTVRFEVPAELAFIVVSPQVEILTKESRGALPDALPYFDAVKSINSATYLVAAFASRDFSKLRGAVSDFMHEPYRLPRIPGGRAAIDAGISAGAYSGWLSGSGSSVLCVAAQDQVPIVRAAMNKAFELAGVKSETRVLAGDNIGLRLL